MSDCNDNLANQKREIEFHYIDVQPVTGETKTKMIRSPVLTPNSAEKEIEVSSSLPTFDSLTPDEQDEEPSTSGAGDATCT